MMKTQRFYTLIVMVIASMAIAQAEENLYNEDSPSSIWFGNVQAGGAMAFGDDSYHVFKDFKNACGWAASLSVGYKFSDAVSARIKVRKMHVYSRTNLEGMAANVDEHPDLYPRDGFYGYNGVALQAEGMLNLMHFLNKKNPGRPFNMYLILGAGFNTFSGYDAVVEKWKRPAGIIINGNYEVDSATHTMPCGAIGGQLELRINRHIGINAEALCTFTLDKMEGVVSEEFYDAYVTACAGLTIYF